MDKTLNDFVKENSKFLRLSNGESFEGVYRGYKVAASTFDPEKDTCNYKLEYPDGQAVFFQTSSVAVAKTFSRLTGGEMIKIVRDGSGNKTKYHITSPDLEVSEVEEPEILDS